jgi:hypothetical protein
MYQTAVCRYEVPTYRQLIYINKIYAIVNNHKMIITEEMWKNMQKDMTDLKKKVPELQLQVLKLTGKVNAMKARMFARGKSDHLSNPGTTRLAGYTDYQKK